MGARNTTWHDKRVHIWRDAHEIPAQWGSSVVTIGNFDGVHQGHREVLRRTHQAAVDLHARSVALTFDPHPLAVLHPDRAPELVTDLDDRLELLAHMDIDAVWVMPFTRELASQSPQQFVREVFVDQLHAVAVVVGHDVRFGHRNAGDLSTLKTLGEQHHFAVIPITDIGDENRTQPPPHSATSTPDHLTRWSSTRARQLILDGDMRAAARVLGRPHWVSGEVVHGDHRGRELGFPTANLEPDSRGLIPADGVYAGYLVRKITAPDTTASATPDGSSEIATPDGSTEAVTPHPTDNATPDSTGIATPDSADGVNPAWPGVSSPVAQPGITRLPAAISVGTNPTFDGISRRVEAHVLGRDDLDLYGEDVRFEFVEQLRPTVRFDSVQDLIEQMHRDVQQCRVALGMSITGL